MRRTAFIFFIGVIFCRFGFTQPVITTKNMALGGGGSTYITDYNANFYNPANIMIYDRTGHLDIGFAGTGILVDPVQNFENPEDQFNNFSDYFYVFKSGKYDIDLNDREQILKDNYDDLQTVSRHTSRLESTLFGIKWRGNKKAVSLAARKRVISTFKVGKGWYDNAPVQKENDLLTDKTLTQNYQSLYEVSLGYAESIQYLSDLTPRLDNFLIGIAPKLVIGGAYQKATWTNKYTTGSSSNSHIQSFDFASSGNISRAVSDYLNGVPANNAINANMEDEIFEINGLGAGLDVGFTYLITLGNDFSTLSSTGERTRKSLRFSVSVTDIGFVRYFDDPLSLSTLPDTTLSSSVPKTSDNVFVGAPGQYLSYVDSYGDTNPFKSSYKSENKFSVLLPSALNGGIMFEYSRLKLMGDFSYYLSNDVFSISDISTSFGIEIRPLKFLPLRAGSHIGGTLPNYYSFGTALETRYWDLTVATQIISGGITDHIFINSATVAALQFHF